MNMYTIFRLPATSTERYCSKLIETSQSFADHGASGSVRAISRADDRRRSAEPFVNARQGRSDFGGSKITDKQFPAIGAETVVNGFGCRLGDQRRQEDAGIQIGTQSSFDSYIRSRISTDVNPMLGRARVRARSHA